MPTISAAIGAGFLVVWAVCEALDRLEERITTARNQRYLTRLLRAEARANRRVGNP